MNDSPVDICSWVGGGGRRDVASAASTATESEIATCYVLRQAGRAHSLASSSGAPGDLLPGNCVTHPFSSGARTLLGTLGFGFILTV